MLVVLWNALILSDLIPFFMQKERNKSPFGYGVKAALGLLFATTLLTLISDGFRKIILKEGRTLNDIKKFVYFIMLICGMIILTFTAAGMAGVL